MPCPFLKMFCRSLCLIGSAALLAEAFSIHKRQDHHGAGFKYQGLFFQKASPEVLNLLNHPLQLQLATGDLPLGAFQRLILDRKTILEGLVGAVATASKGGDEIPLEQEDLVLLESELELYDEKSCQWLSAAEEAGKSITVPGMECYTCGGDHLNIDCPEDQSVSSSAQALKSLLLSNGVAGATAVLQCYGLCCTTLLKACEQVPAAQEGSTRVNPVYHDWLRDHGESWTKLGKLFEVKLLSQQSAVGGISESYNVCLSMLYNWIDAEAATTGIRAGINGDSTLSALMEELERLEPGYGDQRDKHQSFVADLSGTKTQAAAKAMSKVDKAAAYLAAKRKKDTRLYATNTDLPADALQDWDNSGINGPPLKDLNVAIVGAGPSGLLLAHALLKHGADVKVHEARPDPRSNAKGSMAGFAYALGIGIRGRTAIRQSVDEELWSAVKEKGYECDKFRLHAGPFNVKLRDSQPKKRQLWAGSGESKAATVEPSCLLYQSDLCIALMDEITRRYPDRNVLNFQSRVSGCDLENQSLTIESVGGGTSTVNYDLLVGCDGVNSVVRNQLQNASSAFQSTKRALPGEFKVARLNRVPPNLDPNSVALMIPKQGSTTAFIEPTVNGSCCVLFAGRGGEPNNVILRGNDDGNRSAVLAETLLQSFPLLEGADLINVADQLLHQKPGSASSVRCNVYHFESSVALAGDAAHATGGVSGQGVNSALLDSMALADCLFQSYDSSSAKKVASLKQALLQYSQRQVPEGKALYDLSFGPKPSGVKRLIYLLRTVRDTLFRGRLGIGQLPLQTLLTTSMEPFSSIRRKLDYFYDEPFPSSSSVNATLESVSR